MSFDLSNLALNLRLASQYLTANPPPTKEQVEKVAADMREWAEGLEDLQSSESEDVEDETPPSSRYVVQRTVSTWSIISSNDGTIVEGGFFERDNAQSACDEWNKGTRNK